jgi:hypothetical protein
LTRRFCFQETYCAFKTVIPVYWTTQHHIPELLFSNSHVAGSLNIFRLYDKGILMLMSTFPQLSKTSYGFHLHFFSSKFNYFNLLHFIKRMPLFIYFWYCSLFITTTMINLTLWQQNYMSSVMCSTSQVKWGLNNTGHNRLLNIPTVSHFEQHIMRWISLTLGAKD